MIMANEDEKGMVPPAEMAELSSELKDPAPAAEREKLLHPGGPGGTSKAAAESSVGKWTKLLIFSIFASCIGGAFQFGYHIGCVNVPAEVIKIWYRDSHAELFNTTLSEDDISSGPWAISVGIFAVGGMIGGLASGWCADHFGRKGAMLLNNILAILAGVLMSCAKYAGIYHLIIIGRIIIGVNAGLSSALVPMYLTEISPINLRGTIGSINQLVITIAILFSQVIGLPQIFGSVDLWPLVFAFTLVPAIIQLCTLPLCPESPKYNLIVRNETDKAESDLKKLRGEEDVNTEMCVMKDEAAAMAAVERVKVRDLFKGELLWPMFIAMMMMLAQQLSGINVAMFYSTTIFKQAGLGENAIYATLGMGLCNVIMTVVSVYLVDHPKFGRRSLLLSGLVGMLVSSVALVVSMSVHKKNEAAYSGLAYLSMILVFTFVISFATGPGSIPWFFVSELFGSGARGSASSIAVMVNWTANFFVATSFEYLNQVLQQFSFLIFSAILAFFIAFTFIYVPETKGRTVEEVYTEFKQGKSRFARRNS